MCTECARLQHELFESIQRLRAAQYPLASPSLQNQAGGFAVLWRQCRECFDAMDQIRQAISRHAMVHRQPPATGHPAALAMHTAPLASDQAADASLRR